MAWSLIDPILQAWETHQTPPLAEYEPGSWGPVEANALLSKDGRHWMHEESGHMLDD